MKNSANINQNTVLNLKNHKKMLGVHAQNINNANVDGYITLRPILQSTLTNGSISNAKIADISRIFDPLKAEILNDSATKASEATIKNIHISDAINTYFNHINDDLLQNLFDKFTFEPAIFCNDMERFLNDCSTVLDNVDQQQETMHQQLDSSINSINLALQDLHKLSMQRLTASTTEERSIITNSIDKGITSLSELIAVQHYYDHHGILNIRTKDGKYKLLGEDISTLSYQTNHMTGDWCVAINNAQTNQPHYILASNDIGIESTSGGNLHGLLALKVEILPQLRNDFSEAFRASIDTLNAAHNSFTPVKGHSAILGQQKTTLNSTVSGSGTLSLLLNSTKDVFPMAQINLEAMGKEYAHSLTMSDLINDISQQINKKTRLQAEGFCDIQLTPAKSLASNSDIAFAFDLSSHIDDTADKIKSKITLNSISTSDPAAIPTLLPPYSAEIKNGEHLVTYDGRGPQFTISGAALDSDQKFISDVTITADFTVQTGSESAKTIQASFLIPAGTSLTEAMQTKLSAVTASADAEIVTVRSESVLDIFLQNENGERISDANEEGFLCIKSLDPNINFAIKETDCLMSIHSDKKVIKNTGFSAGLKLDDIVVLDQNGKYKIRSDIRNDFSKISCYQFTDLALEKQKSSDVGLKIFGNIALRDVSAKQIMNFKNWIASENKFMSISDYLGVKQYNLQMMTESAEFEANAADSIYTTAQDVFNDLSAVSIEDEIEKITQLQNSYHIAVEFAKIWRTLDDYLLRLIM